MDFKLNEEQQMFRDTIRRFAQNEIAPIAAETDYISYFDRKLCVREVY